MMCCTKTLASLSHTTNTNTRRTQSYRRAQQFRQKVCVVLLLAVFPNYSAFTLGVLLLLHPPKSGKTPEEYCREDEQGTIECRGVLHRGAWGVHSANARVCVWHEQAQQTTSVWTTHTHTHTDQNNNANAPRKKPNCTTETKTFNTHGHHTEHNIAPHTL